LNRLLARHAEATFWMARQIERANNIARILDVHESFSRDAAGAQNWEAVLHLHADADRFLADGRPIDAESVLHFYLLDRSNPTSVLYNLSLARENARMLRHQISTEMWMQLNIFYNRMRAVRPEEVREETVSGICAIIKEACQTHSGILAETLYKDEAWYFSKIGMNIERADQTTRLLDAKYMLLLPGEYQVGSPVDRSQWNALLRSAAGYHAFRRVYSRGMSADKVAAFLIFDERFPRSVSACTAEACATLAALRDEYALAGGAEVLQTLESFLARLRGETIEAVLAGGLHEYLDGVQRSLIDATNQLRAAFFVPATPVAQ